MPPEDSRPPAESRSAHGRARAGAPFAGGFRLATIFRVEVHVDWSLLFIFALVLFHLGAGVLPRWHPDWSPALIWGTALGAAVLFFASILAHELSHALVGRLNGIPVPRITLFLFGGMAHMDREPPSPRAEFLMAIVGPITSLAIGIAAVAAGGMLAGPGFQELARRDPQAALQSLGALASLLFWLGPVNILLALFNVVPGFPLDGGRVLRSFLWWTSGDLAKATRRASLAGQAFGWVLMVWGLMNLLGGLVQGLWLILIGWFLNNAARMSYRQVAIQEGLRDVTVSEIMRTRFSAIAPDTTVETLVRELMSGDQRAFPVLAAEGRLAGIVCLEDLRKVAKEEWPRTPVSGIMTPAGRLAVLPPDASAEHALRALQEQDVDQVPIVDRDEVVGLVRRQDVLKWLSLHADPAGRGIVD